MTVLDSRSLNRATLARQLLLEGSGLPVLDAVGHLGGLQAQEPQEPYVGLWSRLRTFEPASLSDLLVRRSVVRIHLMRRTVHLVTADDAVAWRARHDAMLRQRVLGVYRREFEGTDLDELAEAGRAVLADGGRRHLAYAVSAAAMDRVRPVPTTGGAMRDLWSALDLADVPARGEEAHDVDRWSDL